MKRVSKFSGRKRALASLLDTYESDDAGNTPNKSLISEEPFPEQREEAQKESGSAEPETSPLKAQLVSFLQSMEPLNKLDEVPILQDPLPHNNFLTETVQVNQNDSPLSPKSDTAQPQHQLTNGENAEWQIIVRPEDNSLNLSREHENLSPQNVDISLADHAQCQGQEPLNSGSTPNEAAGDICQVLLNKWQLSVKAYQGPANAC